MNIRQFRFSLASLMSAVLLIAVACAALRYASALWASVLFTLTIGMFLAGILGVVFRSEDQRAFCLGFVLFGGGYLLVVFSPWFRDGFDPKPPHLLTTRLLRYLHPKLSETVPVPGGGSGTNQVTGKFRSVVVTDGGPSMVVVPERGHFEQVGHSLLALVISLAGGILARYFYATRREPDVGAAGPPP